MDISDIVSDSFVELTPDTPVSKLAGVFEDPDVAGVVVRDATVEGVVTRRQLTTSRHPPEAKLDSVVWHVPRLSSDADVRDVARLMIDSDSRLLPVFEGDDLVGVVTGDDLLRAVTPFLDAATVADACTDDLVTVDPQSTVGEALNLFREHHITHLPVLEGDRAVGILSLYDIVDFTTHAASRPQGGEAGGRDAFGGGRSPASGRSRGGGFGAREGERTRVLDLPVRDVMASPVETVDRSATLETAVERMFEVGGSSLVVTADDSLTGIVTKTDVLDALTWEAAGTRAVQIYGADLLDDVSYDEVVAMVDRFDDRDRDTSVIEAKVHLHEHDESRRGTPLVLARIRLYTDRGLFLASGEGYGATHALGEARDALERQLRDDKTYAQSKKHPGADFWERRFGWLVTE